MLWGSTHEPIEPVPLFSRVGRWRSAFLALAAVFLGCVAVLSSSSGGTSLFSALHTVRYTGNKIPSTAYTHSYKKDALEVLLYKRTHPSRNPAGECDFLTHTVGMGCSYASLTMGAEDQACAHRAEALVGPLSYHQIKDGFEPQGDAESWIDKFNAEHYKTFESGEADWNQFMHLGTALYANDLSAHMQRWTNDSTPYKAYHYTNDLDGTPMFMIVTYNPATGNVIEIHSPAAPSIEGLDNQFHALPEDACVEAVGLGQTVAHLNATIQTAMDASKAESAFLNVSNTSSSVYGSVDGLPILIWAKVSHPSMDVDKAAKWMGDNTQIDFTISSGVTDSCKVARAKLKKHEDFGEAVLSFVQMDAHKDVLVKEYIEHVEHIHSTHLGTQRGYDRYLDSHVGLIYRGIYLDDIAPTLVQNNVSFHAFRDAWSSDSLCLNATREMDCGSIWSEGVSGLGMEMHAFFDSDHSFFRDDFQPFYMNFCNDKTNKGAADWDDDNWEASANRPAEPLP